MKGYSHRREDAAAAGRIALTAALRPRHRNREGEPEHRIVKNQPTRWA